MSKRTKPQFPLGINVYFREGRREYSDGKRYLEMTADVVLVKRNDRYPDQSETRYVVATPSDNQFAEDYGPRGVYGSAYVYEKNDGSRGGNFYFRGHELMHTDALEDGARWMKKVLKAYYRICDQEGCPQTEGEWVAYFARAIGARHIVLTKNVAPSPRWKAAYEFVTLTEGAKKINERIAEFRGAGKPQGEEVAS